MPLYFSKDPTEGWLISFIFYNTVPTLLYVLAVFLIIYKKRKELLSNERNDKNIQIISTQIMSTASSVLLWIFLTTLSKSF